MQGAWCERQGSTSLAALCERLVVLDEATRAEPEPASVAAYEAVYARDRQALAERHGIPA